jgi:ribosomal protein S18 acetylase RimI-like enzyme
MLIVVAHVPSQLGTVRELFREYARSLEIDLCFQNFEQELAELPGKYAPPSGQLLLGMEGELATGCVAVRPITEEICEMKRLYVRPEFRGHGVGRILAQAAVEAGRAIGYRRMRLDTLATMERAISLYESLGFRRIAPYYFNPSPSAVFMELALQ